MEKATVGRKQDGRGRPDVHRKIVVVKLTGETGFFLEIISFCLLYFVKLFFSANHTQALCAIYFNQQDYHPTIDMVRNDTTFPYQKKLEEKMNNVLNWTLNAKLFVAFLLLGWNHLRSLAHLSLLLVVLLTFLLTFLAFFLLFSLLLISTIVQS